jgi:hypothetical protein
MNSLHELLTYQIVALWQCIKLGKPGQTLPLRAASEILPTLENAE